MASKAPTPSRPRVNSPQFNLAMNITLVANIATDAARSSMPVVMRLMLKNFLDANPISHTAPARIPTIAAKPPMPTSISFHFSFERRYTDPAINAIAKPILISADATSSSSFIRLTLLKEDIKSLTDFVMFRIFLKMPDMFLTMLIRWNEIAAVMIPAAVMIKS